MSEEEIRKEITKLQRHLWILCRGRTDNGGGDCFIPGHMEYLTD